MAAVDPEPVERKLANVVDNVPKRITQLEFGILSNQDIVNQSVLDVSDRNIYDLTTQGQTRALTKNGPMDRRLGTCTKTTICETCHEKLDSCNGHFGQIRLALPAFHIGYLKNIIDALHNVCKECSQILLDEAQRRSFLRSMRRPALDNLQRTQISRKVSDECRKRKVCLHCDAVNGPIRKVAGHPLKLVHLKFDAYNRSIAKSKVAPESKVDFDASFQAAKEGNNEVDRHLKKAVDDMNPLRVLNIFRRISNSDCELLGLRPGQGRPELFIWQYVPVPPVSIRPSVAQESGNTEDDLTNKLGDIIHMSSLIRAGLQKGQPIQNLMEQWDFMQLQIAMYINSEVPGLQQPGFGKAMRGFCQRLKGKQGRFRQNLSGKRVDFSGRTVIGPDPNLGIDEVAVPMRVATNLTFPEKVSRYNIEKLRACVRRGPFKHPGANFVIKPTENNRKISLAIFTKGNKDAAVVASKLEGTAAKVQIGDIVERHLEDGDIVLFNRQPSLHKLSILSHRAKIRPWRTFRLNECVCNPYNADFDGDEMNLHVPQTEEARAEAIELMGVKHNLATPKNGTPIIAAIQDFITAAYLLSSKENFYDRKTFTQICSFMFNADSIVDPDTNEQMSIEIPEPAIFKPQRLWTGKQVFNVLMRPNKKCKVLVNLDAPCKQYKPKADQAPDLNADDAWLVIRNSEVMCGVMDKSTVGDGKKDSVFYVIMRDFGPDQAVQAMNRLSKLSARWLTNQGFSIGINDVTPSADLVQKKQDLVTKAYDECDKLISDFKEGRLAQDPGCSQEQTMENRIGGLLSQVRQDAGAICFDQLSKWNAPLIMAKCGSKGSNINVSQMVASVGQQMIGGKRVADGFQDRTLPHFPKAARQPASKGFVSNSFFSGLTPTEFLFHAMSGREGLVDTAVKTAETGYMSRRLMKSLEDLSSQYDNTVRNSSAGIVQFQYGDDNLDPVDMEGKAKPVNFERTFSHAITSTWDNSEKTLLPEEVRDHTEAALNTERNKYTRMSLDGTRELDYKDDSHEAVDHLESIRDFLDEVQKFVYGKAERLAKAMTHVGITQPQDGRDGSNAFNLVDGIAKISATALGMFIRLCITKYDRSRVQPGHAVGAVGAQSIGEPGTQMTLKTFHFAGVAGMSITQGVPRIKEIINASKTISTPVISCKLSNKVSEESAQIVKSRIEKTYLRDVIMHIEDVYHKQGGYLSVRIDWDTVHKLHLDLRAEDIGKAIIKAKSLKMAKDGSTWNVSRRGNYVRIFPADPAKKIKKGRSTSTKAKAEDDFFIRMQNLKRLMPDIVVKGYPDAQRAIIKKDDSPNANGEYELELLVEGYGLRDCMTTPGVEGLKVLSNSVLEVLSVLGIEAARATIVTEISSVMGGMDIDPRHMQLLADVMTFKGDVLGITRFGLAKMRDSVLQLASFEKTPDHLFEAASKGKIDAIEGVSECIIMGQSVKLGTGAFSVIRRLGLAQDEVGPNAQRRCYFEEGWASAMKSATAAA